jgi:hypothetical protein
VHSHPSSELSRRHARFGSSSPCRVPPISTHPSARSFNALLHSLVAAALFGPAPTKLDITADLVFVSRNILLNAFVVVGSVD